VGNILVGVALMLTVGQGTAGQGVGQAFAGTWVAELTGTTYVRLEIEPAGGTLRGRLALGNIELDRQGHVSKAEAAPAELKPIFDVTVRGTDISFSRKDVNDTDRFQMRLVDAETAELILNLTDENRKELAAEGIPPPKPFRLKRLPRASSHRAESAGS
jgi:hypothetical protein